MNSYKSLLIKCIHISYFIGLTPSQYHPISPRYFIFALYHIPQFVTMCNAAHISVQNFSGKIFKKKCPIFGICVLHLFSTYIYIKTKRTHPSDRYAFYANGLFPFQPFGSFLQCVQQCLHIVRCIGRRKADT